MRNKKLFLILIACCFFAPFVNAQDQLYLKKGGMQEVKVLVVSATEISFKKYNNLQGPTYHEFISAIEKVVYENGVVETFGDAKPAQVVYPVGTPEPKEVPKKKTNTFAYKKNGITFNITDALFRKITFGYERIIANGYLGIQIPFSFGLASNEVFDVDYLNAYFRNSNNNSNNYYYYNQPPENELLYTEIIRKNTFGLELIAYPAGQRPVSFFVGPSFYYGLVDYKTEERIYTVTSTNPYFTYREDIIKKSGSCASYAGIINLGMTVNSISSIVMKLQLGLGFRQNQTDFDDHAATIFSPSFQIGYKF